MFNEHSDLFDRVLDYGRAQNASITVSDLNEQATFTARRRETMVGGRDVYVKEHEVTDEDHFCAEALVKPNRKLSREFAEQRYSQHDPLPPGETRHDWVLDPEDRDFGEGSAWHKRLESGINEQVEMLQERGMADRPMDIMIDWTARGYHKRSDTDVEEPPGVHRRYEKFETGYGWEDITVTALYRGHAIVLASFSYLPENSHFQTIRYLFDRARDLVNVRNVYADSEFANQKICSYLTHCGLDYVMSTRETSKVTETVEAEMSGTADWAPYEIVGGDHSLHKTTLFAVE